jgi:hypothetical protein
MLHEPAALTPGKKTRYPLDKKLGGLQNLSGSDGEEENLPIPVPEL